MELKRLPGAEITNETLDISIVLPAYNCAEQVAESVKELRLYLVSNSLQGEIIVVDDGSHDNIHHAVQEDNIVKVIRLPFNQGKGAAVRVGMLEAVGEVRVFTDADLPYGTEPVTVALYYILEKGFHAVLGDRSLPSASYEKAGFFRNVISWFAGLIFRTLITGGIYDTQCGFKAFRGDVAQGLFRESRINRFAMDVEIVYLLLKHRLDIKRIPVELQSSSPSTVRVFQDSLRAFLDSCKLPFNWHRGLYRSAELEKISQNDLLQDSEEADKLLKSRE
jgi:dolichyl-phosphate beta-glucosyltransferase